MKFTTSQIQTLRYGRNAFKMNSTSAFSAQFQECDIRFPIENQNEKIE